MPVIIEPSLALAERFWIKVDRSASACWEWQASKTSTGYGQINVQGRPVGAHRVAYVLAYGAIPDGLHIDHLCRNRLCVRPSHLEAVTQAENTRRGRATEARRAQAATITHCPKDHEYTPENTIRTRRGRACRECNRIDARERARRNRAALKEAC